MNWLNVFVLLCIVLSVAAETNYCNLDCGPGVKHIACNNNGNFSEECPSNAEVIQMTDDIKKAILHQHNRIRNAVAGGTSLIGPAARMGEMVWDDELAYLASLNAKVCKNQADSCRKTSRFPSVGQNKVTYSTNSTKLPDYPYLFNSFVYSFWKKSYFTTVSNIKRYGASPSAEPIGTFTLVVTDLNNAVGCSAIQFSKDKKTIIHFTCDYADTNIIGRQVYQIGTKAASDCKTGISEKYSNLCSTAEVYLRE